LPLSWTSKRPLQLFRAALIKHQLIEEGAKVVIGLSGGADSLCLAYLLAGYNLRHNKSWELFAVHINPGFAAWNSARVERACKKIGVPCLVRQLDVPAQLQTRNQNPCFVCGRARRKALFQTASELGCRTVALGHHLEDVNETFLMNLLFNSAGSTILPRQSLFHGALNVVRPLYYLDKLMITNLLRQAGLRPVRNRCPYEGKSSRILLRRFLARLYQQDRRIQTNLFWGIHNLRPEYLPGPVQTSAEPVGSD